LDFAPNTTITNLAKVSDKVVALREYDVITTRNGLVPSIALRLGFTDCNARVLPYVKVGVSYSKSKEWYAEYDPANYGALLLTSHNEVSGVTPIVFLGIEKSCGKKMTGRLEIGYKFNKKKTRDFNGGESTTLTQKDAITIRAMVCYNVKLGSL
jgi:hypothetical protein